MILDKMLQRLFAGLARGPGLNARPQNSRQRIDIMDLAGFCGNSSNTIISSILKTGSVEFPAMVPAFRAPELPSSELTEEQRRAKTAFDRQSRLLTKLRDIAEDATDYYNDYGEHALYIGYPLLSVPSNGGENRSMGAGRILAPLLFSSVSLKVRRDARAGVTIELVSEETDHVVPNPALMAWLEQQTGINTEELLSVESKEEPWHEIHEVLSLVCKTAGLDSVEFTPDTALLPVPRMEELPDKATILSSAVLGLFPISNPGLVRDTKWMIANEAELASPLRRFLSPNVVAVNSDRTLPEAKEWEYARDLVKKDFSAEWLITHSDPCQTEAVSLAQNSEALVIHGPPGTGKSQTIANVIGDHLARNQRVLFVCDKRTALDVVKYRLNSMGLGHLCGVIHDPARDRRDFYLNLQDRLDKLTDVPAAPGGVQEHERLSRRLNDLHAELHSYFNKLHGSEDGNGSFHDLTGKWFNLVAGGAGILNRPTGLSVTMVESHRADCEEILRRAARCQWAVNPFRGKLATDLNRFLSIPPQTIARQFEELGECAAKVDALSDESLVRLDAALPFSDQAAVRRKLADALEVVWNRRDQHLATTLLDKAKRAIAASELPDFNNDSDRLNEPLDRELARQINGSLPTLPEINHRLLAIDEFLPVAGSWKAIFAGGKKSKAAAALDPLALPAAREGLIRARDFYSALKFRLRAADFMERVTGRASEDLPGAEALKGFFAGVREFQDVYAFSGNPATGSFWEYLETSLGDLTAWGEGMVANLRLSAQRAEAISAFEQAMHATELFSTDACAAFIDSLCRNGAALPVVNGFREFLPVLEDAVRLTNRMGDLPGPLQIALNEVIVLKMEWQQAEPEIMTAALGLEIQDRIRQDTELARIDTERVESAFSELVERTQEKQRTVRHLIVDYWREKARYRLLAGTGSRLNALGASLRQRLFIKGKKAMKLRQMLAAGADSREGDPIFDLCPVWMASPSTVAQVFPRETIFDVIIFDEASQCRLEEALPVLLRGKRVVIAGDPKQLPPTRFFEQAVSDSDDTAAETMDEVFDQQQSEAEDLLSAALNLDVQEAFLDVHYRSRNEALIGFSNDSFYSGRLQPIPGHPKNRAGRAPIRLVRIDGVYKDRGNEAEAKAASDLVEELLDASNPPSIGIACFNVTQRDLILDALEKKANHDPGFATRLETARKRQGRDSFEGLFVKNLENVQGDERDHMIICTTFGFAADGSFRRNFGALSRLGGERRLNVLITRARDTIHILTSIPRVEYLAKEEMSDGRRPNGRHYLYDYLRYAEGLERIFDKWQDGLEQARRDEVPECRLWPTTAPSKVAEGMGSALLKKHGVGSMIYWGNDGFCIDSALIHPQMSADVTIGILADFTRYRKTPDPILWEQFRTFVLRQQGWNLHRVWSPTIFRDTEKALNEITNLHRKLGAEESSEYMSGVSMG